MTLRMADPGFAWGLQGPGGEPLMYDSALDSHHQRRSLLELGGDVAAGLKPDRRSPLQSFERYRGGLDLTSGAYWAACFWEAFPFLVIMLAWLFVLVVLLVVRTALYLRGEGFLPVTQRAELPAQRGALLRVVSVASLAVYLVALVAFCTFAVLGQRGGVQLGDTLVSQHSALLTTAEQLSADAVVVQGVVAGTTTVAGEDISVAFVPNPPAVLDDAQAVLSAATDAATESVEVRNAVRHAYDTLQLFVIFASTTSAAVFAVAACAIAFDSRRLVAVALLALPVVSMLLWSTGVVVFGLWISAKDVCGASAVYLDAETRADVRQELQRLLVPCSQTGAAAAVARSGKSAHLSLVQRANDLITEQYEKPAMVPFTDDPLVCERYVLELASGEFVDTQCPYPSPQARFTESDWSSNVGGLRCATNNDIQCAANQTPLTAQVFNAVERTLDVAVVDARLIAAAAALSRCTHTQAVLQAVQMRHCAANDLRRDLGGAWVALCVLGGAGAVLFAAMLFVHKTMRDGGKATVTTVYGPGHALPYNMVAAGGRKEDYQPGQTIWPQGALGGTYAMGGVPDMSRLDDFLTTSGQIQAHRATSLSEAQRERRLSATSSYIGNNPLYDGAHSSQEQPSPV